MTTTFEIDVRSLEGFAKQAGERFADKQALNSIGVGLVDLVQLSFRDSVDPYGTPWAPLKHRKGQILVDTGLLRRSITFKSRAGSVEVGTNLPYAKYHQRGASLVFAARTQPVNKLGRFKSRKDAGKGRKVTQIRFLPGGSGTLPPRPFIPFRGLPPSWKEFVLSELKKLYK
jgi:phage gpG-like protein